MFGLPVDEMKRTLANVDHTLANANGLIDEASALVFEVRETVVVVKSIGQAIARAILGSSSIPK